jgi:glyoxylase-like metal-dependent hydrolase (beta-lactamase superfamily II)
MHAVHGLTLANELTNQYLADFRKRLEKEGTAFFFAMDERIFREYEDGKPVIIALADLVFHGEMQLDPGNCPVRIFQAEAPHTNDSTLVEVPSEKVLILGDCTGGVFPTWEMDEELAGKLAETIRLIQPEICLPGHWTPLDPEIVIQDLLDGNG